MALRILNLEGHQNCMIGSKIMTILLTFFKKKLKLNIGIWAVFPEATDWNIGAVPSDINLSVCIWTESLKTSTIGHISENANCMWFFLDLGPFRFRILGTTHSQSIL